MGRRPAPHLRPTGDRSSRPVSGSLRQCHRARRGRRHRRRGRRVDPRGAVRASTCPIDLSGARHSLRRSRGAARGRRRRPATDSHRRSRHRSRRVRAQPPADVPSTGYRELARVTRRGRLPCSCRCSGRRRPSVEGRDRCGRGGLRFRAPGLVPAVEGRPSNLRPLLPTCSPHWLVRPASRTSRPPGSTVTPTMTDATWSAGGPAWRISRRSSQACLLLKRKPWRTTRVRPSRECRRSKSRWSPSLAGAD